MGRILDLTAGARAIWFNKHHPDAVFVDIRDSVRPSVVCDACDLPAHIGANFDLVVFDPPHKNFAATGNMAKNYGHHTAEEIRNFVYSAAKEAHRVSNAGAFMAFKWSEGGRKLSSVLQWLDAWWEPIVGHGVSHQQRAAGTYWVLLRRRDHINTDLELKP